MIVEMTLAPEDGGTRYAVRVHHWTADDARAHKAMGFHDGWGRCADQLEDLAASL